MPNINLLTAVNTATSSTYVVVSDNGFARRISFDNLTATVEQHFSGPSRTNQNLYTTSSVNFHRLSLIGATTASGLAGSTMGLSMQHSHFDGTAIRTSDIIGILRFGGWDGHSLREGSFYIGASASEDWQYAQTTSTTTTTNFGSNWAIAFQANGIQLTTSSVMRIITGRTISSPTSLTPPIVGLTIGSGADGTTPALIKADSSVTYTGYGRTDLSFVHANIIQGGVTETDTGPDNSTLLSTNRYTFQTSRKSALPGRRLPIVLGDRLGSIDFKGTDYVNTSSASALLDKGGYGACIQVHAIENFTTSTHGTAMELQTTHIGNAGVPLRRLFLASTNNIYTSDRHTFEHATVPVTTMMDISTTGTSFFNGLWQFSSTSSGGVTFPDGSVQNSAFYALPFPPQTSNSAGTVGQIAHDAGYVYICVATNTWKRFAATTF